MYIRTMTEMSTSVLVITGHTQTKRSGGILAFKSTYRKCLTYTHQTFRTAAPRDLTENTKASRKSIKVNNLTPSFESLRDVSDMAVDLLWLSPRYWMPAMNPFILSSKLSSIIIALYFSAADQIGEAKVNVAYQLVNLYGSGSQRG